MDVNWLPPPPGPSPAQTPSQPEWSWRGTGHRVLWPSYGDHGPERDPPVIQMEPRGPVAGSLGDMMSSGSVSSRSPGWQAGAEARGFFPLGQEEAKEISRRTIPGLVRAKQGGVGHVQSLWKA